MICPGHRTSTFTKSEHSIVSASIVKTGIELTWDDGRRNTYNNFMLRENSPDEKTLHPLSREMLISPLELPDDLSAEETSVDATGALMVTWSDQHL